MSRNSTEERISELENKMMEIMSKEQNKIKRMKRTEENSLRDLSDNIKCTNIRITGVPEEEENPRDRRAWWAAISGVAQS